MTIQGVECISVKYDDTIFPEQPTVFQVELPITSLNVMRVGSGEPVLMVPATISRLEDWREMTQFVGQYFETYFFELPGHGQSTPFPESYHSDLTAAAIEMLLNALGFDRVILLGFSFGGILTMKTLYRIQERIKALVLLAPCIGPESLQHSQSQRLLIRLMISCLSHRRAQEYFVAMVRHPVLGHLFTDLVMALGELEGCSAELGEKIRLLTRSTVDVLAHQILEILSVQFPRPQRPFPQPCYFGMSIHDPILNFDSVHTFLQHHFSDLTTMRFTQPYHQPPHRLSVSEYNRDYGDLLVNIAERMYSLHPHPARLQG